MDKELSQQPSAQSERASPGSWPEDRSLTYSGVVGRTYPAAELNARDYLIDPAGYDSEGDWAFCRFSSKEIPAIRLGYQLGSFNIGADERRRDPSLLQLHLEVMTRDGGMLWVPTGRYPGELLESSPESKNVRLTADGTEILRISGWPQMSWYMRSEDGELEVELEVDVGTVTVLPDCLLPHSVFSMWETLGHARGRVRVGSIQEDVEGYVFYDHTRVVHQRHKVAPRQMYLYTTMVLDDGSGLFGYHAIDADGHLLDYYCFGIHVDADGKGSFLANARSRDLTFDADGLPSSWRLDWRGDNMAIEAAIEVQPLPLKKGWGGSLWPRSRADYSVFPLVLDGRVRVEQNGTMVETGGQGLAEYYDADKWRSS